LPNGIIAIGVSSSPRKYIPIGMNTYIESGKKAFFKICSIYNLG